MSTNQPKHDPLTPVKVALRLIDDMIALMAEEEKILKSEDMVRHRALLDTKQRMALEYRQNMKTLKDNPDLLKKAPADLRLLVKTSYEKLLKIAEHNAALLQTSIDGTKNLLSSIVTVVKNEALPQSYSHMGQKANQLGSYSPLCPPVTGSRTA